MSKIYMAFDTETSGMLDFKQDIMHESQPRIVQLAAILYDEQGEILEQMNMIAKPDGWEIDAGAQSVHGISLETCEAQGVPMPEILARFNEMKSKCTDRVAYNATYDKRMLLREANLYDIPHDSIGIITHDVMKMATPVCKMPPTEKMMARGRRDFKSPKLEEAYYIMFGERMDGAHDAMNDVKATSRLFFHLLAGGTALEEVA